MKKVSAVLLLIFVAAALFASGIENNSNMSVGYMRILSKNTETKKADAVFYNPAGTAFMDKGLYVELGNQFIYLGYTNEAENTPLNDDFYGFDSILLYPSGEIVWNTGSVALFAGTGMAARGGFANFDSGSFNSTYVLSVMGPPLNGTPHSFDVSAAVYGQILGASYAVNDFISVSGAARYMQGERTQKLILDSDPGVGTTLLIDSKATAEGFGAVFGLHYNASDEIDISLQYQTKVKLKYKEVSVDGYAPYLTLLQIAEGDEYNIDLPAVFGMGIGYQLFDDLYTSLSFNYYFNKDALWETGVTGEYDYDDSWEIGGGAEFTFNEIIALSGGILYSIQGYRDDQNSAEGPALDSLIISSGVGLTFFNDLIIDIGIAKPFFFDTEYETALGRINLDRKMFFIGIGATYRFF